MVRSILKIWKLAQTVNLTLECGRLSMDYPMAQSTKANTPWVVAASQTMTQPLNVLIVVGRESTLTILGAIKQGELQTGGKDGVKERN